MLFESNFSIHCRSGCLTYTRTVHSSFIQPYCDQQLSDPIISLENRKITTESLYELFSLYLPEFTLKFQQNYIILAFRLYPNDFCIFFQKIFNSLCLIEEISRKILKYSEFSSEDSQSLSDCKKILNHFANLDDSSRRTESKEILMIISNPYLSKFCNTPEINVDDFKTEKPLSLKLEYSFKYTLKLKIYLKFAVCTVFNNYSGYSNSSILQGINKRFFIKNSDFLVNKLKRRLIINESNLKCALVDGLKGGGSSCFLRRVSEQIEVNDRRINPASKYEVNSFILEFEKNAHTYQENRIKESINFLAASKIEKIKLYSDSKSEKIMKSVDNFSSSLLTGSVKTKALIYLALLKPAKMRDPFQAGLKILKSLYKETLWYNPKYYDIRRSAVNLARKLIAVGLLKNPDFPDDKKDLINYVSMLELIVKENEIVTPDNIVLISLKGIKEMIETPYKIYFLWYWLDKSEGLVDLMDSLFYLQKYDTPTSRKCKLKDDKGIFLEYGRKISTYFILFDSIQEFSRSFVKSENIKILEHVNSEELTRKKDSTDYYVIHLEFIYILLQQESLDATIRQKFLENIKNLDLENPEIAEKCLLILRKTILNSNESIRIISKDLKDKIPYHLKLNNKRIESALEFQSISKKFSENSKNDISSIKPEKFYTNRVNDLKFFRQNELSKISKIFESTKKNYVVIEGLFRMGKKRLAIYYANMYQYNYHCILIKNIKSEQKMIDFFNSIDSNSYRNKDSLVIAISFIEVGSIIDFIKNLEHLKVIIVSGVKNPTIPKRLQVTGLDEQLSERFLELHLGMKLKKTCKNISKEKFSKIIKCLQGWPLALELVAADMHQNALNLEQRLDVYIECFSNQKIEEGLLKFIFKNKLSSINQKLLDIIWFCKPPQVPVWICRKILHDKEFKKQATLLESHFIIERFDSYISIHPFIHNNIPKRDREVVRKEFVAETLKKFETLKENFDKKKKFIRHVSFFLQREKIDDFQYLEIQLKFIYFYFYQENYTDYIAKIYLHCDLFINKVKEITCSKKKKIDFLGNLIRVFFDYQDYQKVEELLSISFHIDQEVSLFRYYFSAKVKLLSVLNLKNSANTDLHLLESIKTHLEKFTALKDLVDDFPVYQIADSLFILAFEYQNKHYLKEALKYLKISCNDDQSENKTYEAFTQFMTFKAFCIFCGTVCNELDPNCTKCEIVANELAYMKYCIATLYLEDYRTFDEKFEINDISYENLCREYLSSTQIKSLIKTCNDLQLFLMTYSEKNENSCKFSMNYKLFYKIKFSSEYFEKAFAIICSYTKEKEEDNGFEVYPKAFSYFKSYFGTMLSSFNQCEVVNQGEQLLINILISPHRFHFYEKATNFVFNDRVFLKDYFLLYLWADLLLSYKNRLEEALEKLGIFFFMYSRDLSQCRKFKGIDPVLCVKTMQKISYSIEISGHDAFEFDKLLFNFLKVYQSCLNRHKSNLKGWSGNLKHQKFFYHEKDLQIELIEINQKIIKKFESFRTEDTDEIINIYISAIHENSFVNHLSKTDLFKYNYKVSLFLYPRKSEESLVYMENSLKTYQKTNDYEILQNLSRFSSRIIKNYDKKQNPTKLIEFLNLSIEIDNLILSFKLGNNEELKLRLVGKHQKASEFYLNLNDIKKANDELIKSFNLLSAETHPDMEKVLKSILIKLLSLPQEKESKKFYLKNLTQLEKDQKTLAEYFKEIALCEMTEDDIISSYSKSASFYGQAGLKTNQSRILLICAKRLEKHDPKQAILYFKNFLAIEVEIKSKTPEKLAKVFSRLIKICENSKEFKEARNCLEKFIVMYKDYNFSMYKQEIFNIYQEIIELQINSQSEKNEYIKQSIEIAKLLDNKKYIAEKYEEIALTTADPEIKLNTAICYYQLGKYKKALKYYKESAKQFKSEGNTEKACKSYEMVIKLFVMVKGRETQPFLLETFSYISKFSEESFVENLYFSTLASEDDDPLKKSLLYSNFAEILINSKKSLGRIEKYFLDSLDLVTEVLNQSELIQKSLEFSNKLKPYDISLSLKFQEKAISFLSSDKANDLQRVDLFRDLAEKSRSFGLLNESIRYFKKSLKFGKTDESDQGVMKSIEDMLSLAEVYENIKNFQLAQMTRCTALDICVKKSFVGKTIIQKNIEAMDKNEKILRNNITTADFFNLKSRFKNYNRKKSLTPTISTISDIEHPFRGHNK